MQKFNTRDRVKVKGITDATFVVTYLNFDERGTIFKGYDIQEVSDKTHRFSMEYVPEDRLVAAGPELQDKDFVQNEEGDIFVARKTSDGNTMFVDPWNLLAEADGLNDWDLYTLEDIGGEDFEIIGKFVPIVKD